MGAERGLLHQVEERLAALVQVRGVVAAVVVDAEGLLIASKRAQPTDCELLAAAARLVLATAEQAHQLGATGPIDMIASEGPRGSLLVAPVWEGMALGVSIAPDAMVGSVRFALRSAARELAPLFGG
jgi:predicted regulator of Ras-like GTPase activity (Roadblock/LC7/MglB family)